MYVTEDENEVVRWVSRKVRRTAVAAVDNDVADDGGSYTGYTCIAAESGWGAMVQRKMTKEGVQRDDDVWDAFEEAANVEGDSAHKTVPTLKLTEKQNRDYMNMTDKYAFHRAVSGLHLAEMAGEHNLT